MVSFHLKRKIQNYTPFTDELTKWWKLRNCQTNPYPAFYCLLPPSARECVCTEHNHAVQDRWLTGSKSTQLPSSVSLAVKGIYFYRVFKIKLCGVSCATNCVIQGREFAPIFAVLLCVNSRIQWKIWRRIAPYTGCLRESYKMKQSWTTDVLKLSIGTYVINAVIKIPITDLSSLENLQLRLTVQFVSA